MIIPSRHQPSLPMDRFVSTETPGEEAIPARTWLVGRHNIENALAAAAAAHALGFEGETIRRGLEAVRCVPGRLEPVEGAQPFRVFVDYGDDA